MRGAKTGLPAFSQGIVDGLGMFSQRSEASVTHSMNIVGDVQSVVCLAWSSR
jgi:hypothetical protein